MDIEGDDRMTIEQIVNCSADELEKMSDEELLKHFDQYLNVTRPERVSAVVKRTEQNLMNNNPKLALGMSLLKGLGVDTAGVFAPTKKWRK